LRRLFLSVLIGATAATLAYFVSVAMANPDSMVAPHRTGSAGRTYGFVFYVVAFAGAAGFSIALIVLNRYADKKHRESLVARAQLEER
jgi:hypothetical protein